MKPRKPLKRVSAKRAAEVSRHSKVRKEFLDTHPICFRCGSAIPREHRQLHHFFGRTGLLLNWVPGFRMADRWCHEHIELNRNESVERGWRAPNALFGRPSLVLPMFGENGESLPESMKPQFT